MVRNVFFTNPCYPRIWRQEKLAGPSLSRHPRSSVINLRTQARQALGESKKALEDFHESIRLAPEEPLWHDTRARSWERRHRSDLAAADHRKAGALRLGPSHKGLTTENAAEKTSE
jgi:hypothetical protein